MNVIRDVAQYRTLHEPISLLRAAAELPERNNLYLSPATKALSILPDQFKADFHEETSYEVWSRSEVTLSSGKWVDDNFFSSSVHPYYMLRDPETPGSFITPTIVMNGGLYLEWFQTETAKEQVLEVVWGGFTYQIFAAGGVKVGLGGNEIASGSVASPFLDVPDDSENAALLSTTRRLMIRASRSGVIELVGDGGAFTFSRPDRTFDITVEDDLIIPESTAVVTIKGGIQRILAAPLTYSSGTAKSRLGRMLNTPPTGATFLPHSWGKGDTRTVSLLDSSGSVFVADNSRNEFYIQVSLTTSNTYRTPELYWALSRYEGEVTSTTADEEDITDQLGRDFVLSVEPGLGGTRLRGSIVWNDGFGLPEAQFNCPIEIQIDGKTFWQGISGPVKMVYHARDEATTGTFEAGDHSMILERTINPARLAFDGIPFTTAAANCIYPAGVTNTDITPSTFLVEGNPSGDNNFGFLAEPGAAWNDIAQRLFALYAPNWIQGYRWRDGEIQYFAYDPKMLDTTPLVTLYATQADYEEDGGVGDLPEDQRYYTFQRGVLEPRATEVVVQGLNASSGKAILGLYNGGTNLDDPTTAPDSRPNGWLGYPRRYAREGAELGSVDAVIRTAEFLWNRVGKVRELIEIEAPILWDDTNPIWIGDHIELYATGTYRVQSMQVRFSPNKHVATYTLESV